MTKKRSDGGICKAVEQISVLRAQGQHKDLKNHSITVQRTRSNSMSYASLCRRH
jgi:hypothetical protein